MFCEMNLIKIKDDFKQKIVIQEATTDKLIKADGMNKSPKILPLRTMFKKLFE